jgi:ketosteroid isomerase-like protein
MMPGDRKQIPQIDDAEAIRKVATDFLLAYNAADIERVCALLTEGAVLLPPNEPPVNGLEAVRCRIESFFIGFTFSIKFNPQQTDIVDNLAFERGSYAAFALLKGDRSEPRGGYGEYLLIFERDARGWKIAAFGTAAAEGTPPQNVAGPDRLAHVLEATRRRSNGA